MIPRIYETLPKELNECAKCHFVLPLAEFGKSKTKKNGLDSRCRIRKRPTKEQRAQRNPELAKVSNKRWRQKNAKSYVRLKKYGLSKDDYQAILLKQNSKCAICGIPQAELLYDLAIDHCHITETIRGLLCKKCNLGIGNFGDNIAILKNAIKYLGKA